MKRRRNLCDGCGAEWNLLARIGSRHLCAGCAPAAFCLPAARRVTPRRIEEVS